MADTIGKTELARMFIEAAEQIRREHQHLSVLDAVAGDGDHGVTMLRVAERFEEAAKDFPSEGLCTSFRKAGLNIMSVDGGASSAILGIFFAGMADAEIGESSMNCAVVAQVFESGLRAVSRQTKAQPGDKTLMDALVPAVNAIRGAAESGRSITEAFQDAATAANEGANSTKDLVAQYGRAKFVGEKTRGYPDAGATSIALIFHGFSMGLIPERKD